MHGNSEIHGLDSCKTALIEESSPYFPEPGKEWFDRALAAIAESHEVEQDLGLYSAMARRKLGANRLERANTIHTRFAAVDVSRWSSAESARVAFLMAAVEREPGQAERVISDYYRMGDESEQMALLRGLIFFAPAEFLSVIALEAGRTNSLELLSALTLDNPYPACFYSDQQFNQMVLKALFLGLAVERIVNLAQRANPDLARMGENYVVEREQAGRAVPADIWLAIGPCASEAGVRQMLTYLEHEETGHRYYAARALIRRSAQDATLVPALRRRLDAEREPLILELLREALEA